MAWWSAVQREPYRLFFPLGAFFAVAGVGQWFLYGTALTPVYSGFFHSSVQIWLFMACFVVGFLGTAVPRFTGSKHAGGLRIILWLSEFVFIFWALLKSHWVAAEIGYLALLATIVAFLFACFIGRTASNPPAGFMWMPVAMLLAILGIGFLIAGQTGLVASYWQVRGRIMEEQGFLMSLVMGIGSFLGPRLMGESPRLSEGRIRLCHFLAIPVFFFSFFLEASPYEPYAYFMRGVISIIIFGVSGALLFRTPRAGTLFSKYLAVIFWLFPLSLFLIAANLKSKTTFFHILFIGGFAALTFLISSMVVLSHAGQGDEISKSGRFFKWMAFLTVLALFLRLTAVFLGGYYFAGLAAASFVWMANTALWFVFLLRYFFTIPDQNVMEKLHENVRIKKDQRAC